MSTAYHGSSFNPEPPQQEPEKSDSISKVHLASDRRRTDGYSVYGNKRKSIGIKIDPQIYEEFKPIAQRYAGSVCCAVEILMLSLIQPLKYNKVHLGNTGEFNGGGLHVTIEDMHLHRNLRERRRVDPDALADPVADDPIRVVYELFKDSDSIKFIEVGKAFRELKVHFSKKDVDVVVKRLVKDGVKVVRDNK